MFAPASTPAPAIVAKLEKALAEAIHDPACRRSSGLWRLNPATRRPNNSSTSSKADIVKFRDVVKAANLKFEE